MSKRRLDLRYETLGAASREVRSSMEHGYELAGNWSLAQILDHLTLTMNMCMERPDFKFNIFVRTFAQMLFPRFIRKGTPVSLRASAPPPLAPREGLDLDEATARFHAVIEKLEDESTEFQPFHPLLGNLDRDGWLEMQRWHNAHHLSFMVPTVDDGD
ncbi:MAG: DUF1569 domain-containing protein [Planctomycetota bacterium]